MLYIPAFYDGTEPIWKDGLQAQLDQIDYDRLIDILRALVAAHHAHITVEQLIEMISHAITQKGD